MAAQNLVVDERRVSDRRAQRHLEAAPEPCGKSSDEDWTTHTRSRVELLLVEQQAATEHAVEALSHCVAALQTMTNELRAARAAAVAANRAAHLAAGAVSGVAT